MIGTIFGLSLGVAFNEATYNSVVPASYVEEYPYSESKDSLPWLVAKFEKQVADEANKDATYDVQVFADDTQLEFRGNVSSIGELSEDKKTLTAKASQYLMFEIVKDLGIMRPAKVTWLKIRMIFSGRVYEAQTFVTPGTI